MFEEYFENLEYEIPKNAINSHEQFMFDHIIPSNSTMVREHFENVHLRIPKNIMKSLTLYV